MRTTEGANYRNHYRDSELTKRADAIEWLKRHGSGFRGSKKREEKRWQKRKRQREVAICSHQALTTSRKRHVISGKWIGARLRSTLYR
jgi:hypothetical protein